MFVDENPPRLPGACGQAIGEVVAPATNGLFRASNTNPPWEEAGAGIMQSLLIIKIPSTCLCVRAEQACW